MSHGFWWGGHALSICKPWISHTKGTVQLHIYSTCTTPECRFYTAMPSPSIHVSEAQFPRDAQVATTLLLAYTNALNVDLTFQSFKEELTQLPGKYAPENGGALLLAYHQPDDTNAGGGGTAAAAATAKAAGQPTSPFPTPSMASLPLGNYIGCVAIRRHQPSDVCEFKRLYIVPEARRLGAGAVLINAALEKARELGYKEGVLDTLASMVAARKLYARYGFEETEKYYDNPLLNVVYYKAKLV